MRWERDHAGSADILSAMSAQREKREHTSLDANKSWQQTGCLRSQLTKRDHSSLEANESGSRQDVCAPS